MLTEVDATIATRPYLTSSVINHKNGLKPEMKPHKRKHISSL